MGRNHRIRAAGTKIAEPSADGVSDAPPDSSLSSNCSMSHVKYILSPDDPHIAPYRALKDKQLAARHGLFIVEGEWPVRRLLDSPIRVHSLLMTPERFPAGWQTEAAIFVADKNVLEQIVGFDFHRGVLALGVRPQLPSPVELLHDAPRRLVVLPEINDPENLGSLMRTGAALGYRHFLLGPSCCDPFARRAVRTSMGAVFSLMLARSAEMPKDLRRLRSAGFSLHAAVVGENARPLGEVTPPPRVALLFGAEAFGLSDEITALCDQCVTIPTVAGVDSLNVCVAAGIVMSHYLFGKHVNH